METLLIVDDDPAAREKVAGVLEGGSYAFLSAADAAQAQDILRREHARINAVVLDWILPEMTGIDLLRWMKQSETLSTIPVILQTIMDSPAHVKEGIDAGAFYFLSKPADPHILRSIVRAAISDRAYKMMLVKMLADCQNPLGCMTEGEFRFRTLREGERLAVVIAHASPSPPRAMGISEIFLNAVEHGNLGITYDDKTELLDTGTWAQEVERRLALPENAHKEVVVRVSRTADHLTVLVRDCGSGFDFSKYLHFDETRVFHNHGRGIAIVSSDLKLEFLGNGNTVRITI